MSPAKCLRLAALLLTLPGCVIRSTYAPAPSRPGQPDDSGMSSLATLAFVLVIFAFLFACGTSVAAIYTQDQDRRRISVGVAAGAAVLAAVFFLLA